MDVGTHYLEVVYGDKDKFDLEKVKIVATIKGMDLQNNVFTCDHAGIVLKDSPYYLDITKDIIGKTKSNNVEISFNKNYSYMDAPIKIIARCNSSNWSSFHDITKILYTLYYDDEELESIFINLDL